MVSRNIPILIFCALVLGLGLGLVAPVMVTLARSEESREMLMDSAPVKLPVTGSAAAAAQPAGGITLTKTFVGSDFYPTSSAVSYHSIGSSRYLTSLLLSYGLTARLDLPQGARIDSVVFYFVDNSDQEIEFSLNLYEPDNYGGLSLMNGFSTGAPSDQVQSLTVLPLIETVIDNSLGAYHLRVNLNEADSSQSLYGAEVTYTVPAAFLPLMQR